MTSENEINIKGLYSLYPNILGILLRDNTTKKKINQVLYSHTELFTKDIFFNWRMK